jgi:hypothetical protein
MAPSKEFALIIVFPFFRYAFWLFTGDYFRAFSLFICTTQILLAIVALQKIIANKKAVQYYEELLNKERK